MQRRKASYRFFPIRSDHFCAQVGTSLAFGRLWHSQSGSLEGLVLSVFFFFLKVPRGNILSVSEMWAAGGIGSLLFSLAPLSSALQSCGSEILPSLKP